MTGISTFDPLSLDRDSILDEAMRTAGSSDFGDKAFREPFERLVAALDGEAKLNAVGRGMQRARIVGLIVNRLRTEAYIARHPEILDEEICEPIVIVGLPRTGTTMLHRMIAADPENYSLLWWESRNPAPFAAPEDWLGSKERDPRILDAEAEVAAMLEGAPDLMAMHPLEAEGPDEEIMLLEHAFFSTNPEAFVNVAEFGAWQDDQDQTSGYRYLERLLKFLQWQKKQRGEVARRWVLKSPHHLGFMDLLFKVFPDARVIQTHRDPAQTIPSLASLIQAIRAMGSDDADPHVTGQQWSDRMSRAMSRCMKVREKHQDQFIDVFFADVLKDPLTEIRKSYEFAGWKLTDAAIDSMKTWAVDNSRDKREAHHYTLEEFGLTQAGIERDFAAYRDRFVLGR
ncbi:MAG TPA: sulfotransferase [Myxococcales bacterium]|nr:sulfotransferase [Myxococcales bacterium]HIM03364.1 sulfotransferase [Myxococcales bacterium]